MKKLILLSLSAVLFMQSLLAMPFPTPPAGFTWQEVPELKTAFLKPDGWFYKREEQKGILLISLPKRISIKMAGSKQGLLSMCFTSRKILRWNGVRA
jgi:hypothetical protein